MALAEAAAPRRMTARFAPHERLLARAIVLVLGAGLLGASGALFVILLYGRLIPSGSLAELAFAGSVALAIVGFQATARARAGHLADEASQKLFAHLEAEGGGQQQQGLPLIRALRSRSFLLAADLGWVPFFLLAVLVIHPMLGIASGAAILAVLRFGASVEPATSKPDALFRQRERRRRLALASLRDGMQILLLTLGGALAISGKMQIGEIVAATLLSIRALGAVSAALDDAPALRAALHSWQQIRARGEIG